MDTVVVILIALAVAVVVFLVMRRVNERRLVQRREVAGDQYERASVAGAKAEDAERVAQRHRTEAEEHAQRARELDPEPVETEEEAGERRGRRRS